jgi:hypothetical protein
MITKLNKNKHAIAAKYNLLDNEAESRILENN